MTQVGDLLDGRYRLDRRIGKGGMGEVWVATDERLAREVAVKTIATDAVAAAATVGAAAGLARFQREAHATAGINHPNVVTVYDSGIDGATAYLVMEYLPGRDLATRLINDGPMPVREALSAAAAIASGLAAAHAKGVVHRDIKPANVMYDAQGNVKVVDFGIAALQDAGTTAMTSAGTVLGSAPYLSPEQAGGYPATVRSDLYSLGCCLMTMLTAEPPFRGEHPLSLLRAHMDSAPPLVSERRPGVDRDVDDLVDQLLAKDPRDRPASAQEVSERLTALAAGDRPGRKGPAAGLGTAAATEALGAPLAGRPGQAERARAEYAAESRRTSAYPAAVQPPPRRTTAVPAAQPQPRSTSAMPAAQAQPRPDGGRPLPPVAPRPVGERPGGGYVEAAPATPVRERPAWMPWGVGLLALAVVATVIVLLSTLFSGDGKDEPSTPVPATSSTSSSSSTSASTPPPLSRTSSSTTRTWEPSRTTTTTTWEPSRPSSTSSFTSSTSSSTTYDTPPEPEPTPTDTPAPATTAPMSANP